MKDRNLASTVINQTFEFIGVLTLDGKLLEANQSALDYLGMQLEHVQGQPFWQTPWWTHSPQQQQQLHNSIDQAKTGKLVRCEVTHRSACGAIEPFDFSLKLLRNETGEGSFLICEGRNISPYKQAEQRLQVAYTELEERMAESVTEKKQLEAQFIRAQRLESIGILASGIAHDLNNILTPMLAIAQLLSRRFPNADESTQHLLEILETNAKRGSELVKQVLSSARGCNGQRTLMQVEHLLTEVAKIAQQTFPKSIEIQTEISPKALWLVHADVTQLHQVMMNLCVNARDAMPDGGKLAIAAENCTIDRTSVQLHADARIGSYVKLTISDTGIGIAPDVLNRIFDSFFTTKSPEKGTGLGLPTVMTIVKNHGGFLNFATQVGCGTTFTIYLPAIEQVEVNSSDESEALDGNGELINRRQ